LNLELFNRRAEMLDTVCKGFQPVVVVNQLAKKYNISEKTLWNDWGRREKWVPILLASRHFSGFAETQGAKVTLVEKGAWSIFHNGNNDNAKVGALKIILKSVEAHGNIVLSSDVLSRIEKIEQDLAKKKLMEDKNCENQQGNNETISGS